MPEIAPLEAGEPRRLGPFRIVGRIGEGGQGVVYLGVKESGERAAIKLLHVKFSGDAIARSRFAREARAAQRVASFCTAGVVDADLEGDTPYIASEYIEGRSLREVVEADGPFRGVALQRLAIGTATALTAIHHAAIVHRDFKPDNVLIAADGPRVVDFGIARIIDSTGTITSRAIGTPAYMAPEQISGADVGPYTDVFAWGATIAFAATGETVFAGDSIAVVLNRILNHEVDVGVMPEPLRGAVRSALTKSPAARPSADQILLRMLGHPESVDATPAVLNEGAQIAGPDPGEPTTPIRMRAPSTTAPDGPPVPSTGFRARPPGPSPARHEHPPSPGPGDRASSPGYGEHPSSPGYGGQVSSPGYGDRASSPGYGGQVSSPGYGERPSSPGYGDRASSPGYGEHPSSPGYGGQMSSPGYGEHPSSPGYGGQVSSPGSGEPSATVPPPSWQATIPDPAPPRRSHRGRWIAAAAALLVAGAAAVAATGWPPSFGTESRPTGSAPATFASVADKAAKTGRLTVGMRDFLPGVALNSGGRWSGFEVDLATEIAKALGVPASGVTFRATSREERPGLLASGDLDLVVSTYSINDKDDVTFAGPYYLAHVDVLVKDGSPIVSAAGLEGKRVCQPAGSGSVRALQGEVDRLVLVPADTYTGCMNKLLAGEVDAVPGDDLVLAGFGNRESIGYKVVGLKLTDERYAVAMKKGDRRTCKAVQGVIADLYESGTMAKLLDRHFSRVDFATREDGVPAMASCG
ncbi:serine/threonine-protein kinase PknD [Streptosporangium roseum]|uniref:Serine/threonine protein kinase-like protein n=2 Tax=Streptosporangium roseum TaxID=2001 RepID=D2BD13_STRRD|nr:Serine/threonine protein kinase-like protein [Streptosporangium roseum DSM 43021]